MSSDTQNPNSRAAGGPVEHVSLRDGVTVRRDGRGVPYVTASNEDDLYFGQGYATACDRLWQMDLLRRTARGELAEVFGSAAVERDRLHRVYGFARLAERLLERASARMRAALETYARGVNARIQECGTDSLPPEFRVLRYAPREWTALDSLSLGKLFAESLSVSADVDILRALLADLLPPERLRELLPVTSPLDVIVVGDDGEGRERTNSPALDGGASRANLGEAERAALLALLRSMRRARAADGGDGEVGSNSWVVGGKLTASGRPLLSNDPHLAPTSPSIWHITHLSTPEVEVSGVSLPGLPGVMIGRNKWIAWGLTNLCPDVQDVYFEKFQEGDPLSYMTPDGLRRAEVRHEEIVVRRPPGDAGDKVVTVDVKVTRHGPVIYESGPVAISLRWTALDADVVDLETFLAINRARDWGEFVEALRGFGGPPQNFVYAAPPATSATTARGASPSGRRATAVSPTTARPTTASGSGSSRSKNCRTPSTRPRASSSPRTTASSAATTRTT